MVLGVRQLTYIIGIFKGSKRVTMATEFKQTSAKFALISVLCKKSRNLVHFIGLTISTIFRKNRENCLYLEW